MVHLGSNTMAGKGGQVAQMKLIGTDSSSSTYTFGLTIQQTNNNIQNGEISDLIVSLYPSLELRGQSRENKKHDMSNSPQLRQGSKIEKSHLTIQDCLAIIRSVHNQKLQEIQLKKSIHQKNSSGLDDKTIKSLQQRSDYGEDRNVTSIYTKMSVGPDGFGSSISHTARGQSIVSDYGAQTENQNHGKYDGSKISLVNIVTALAISN